MPGTTSKEISDVVMDTKIIELRMAVRALPSENRLVNLAVKSEVLRISDLLNKQAIEQDTQPTLHMTAVASNYPSTLKT